MRRWQYNRVSSCACAQFNMRSNQQRCGRHLCLGRRSVRSEQRLLSRPDLRLCRCACTPTCSENNQCSSNCCASFSNDAGSNGFACAPSAVCSECVAVNNSCATDQDCCDNGYAPGNYLCVDLICSAVCVVNADCVSGCCSEYTTADGSQSGRYCAESSYCN